MYTKRLKKIGALITAIVMCIVCVVNASGCAIARDFNGKLVIESELSECIKKKTDELDNEYIAVSLYFIQTLEYPYEDMYSDENIESYMAFCDMMEALNQQKLDELGLKDYVWASPSNTLQVVRVFYSSYNDFLNSPDYDIIVSASNAEDVLQVYIKIYDTSLKPLWGHTTYADVEDLYYDYTKDSIYYDIGVPTSGNTYNGSGVKIGILELAYPNSSNMSNNNCEIIQNPKYNSFPNYNEIPHYVNHVHNLYNILGGSDGIANDAYFYFTAYNDDESFVTAVNLLVSRGVNIINISNGDGIGSYRNISKFIDKVTEDSDVVFVVSAGNYNSGNNELYVNELATGVNCICVGSNNFDLRISDFTLTNDLDEDLLNPTITAPGAGLHGFGNAEALSGTSYSAPIVAGVIAMLMDEFPILKDHPEMVITLLTNTATKALGQNDIVDDDAGYGIINYARARQYFSNLYNFIMTMEYDAQRDIVYEKSVYVPVGSKLSVTTFVLDNVDGFAYNYDTAHNVTTPGFTPIYVTVQNQSTWEIVGGESYSNFSSVEIVNNGPRTAEYKIRVYTAVDKATSEYEHCGIHYVVESTATPPHEHRYTDRIEQISGNMASHRWYCSCGSSKTESHTWESAGIGQTMKCIWCGYDSNIMINGVGDEEQYIK